MLNLRGAVGEYLNVTRPIWATKSPAMGNITVRLNPDCCFLITSVSVNSLPCKGYARALCAPLSCKRYSPSLLPSSLQKHDPLGIGEAPGTPKRTTHVRVSLILCQQVGFVVRVIIQVHIYVQNTFRLYYAWLCCIIVLTYLVGLLVCWLVGWLVCS
jgi:hypothetical protein